MRLEYVLHKYKLDPMRLAQILCHAVKDITESGQPGNEISYF